ncbi:hypothetical protein NYR55_11700 [Sphingomonas sp. BGYR3]|nr:hypothetical protein [Sphingomonas sp. BGYR3]MDG5489279.1 hypothetical protein [Sphingomonas sp. BGYR3]
MRKGFTLAWRKGFILDEELRRVAQPLRTSGHGAYLPELLERDRQWN